MTKRCDHVRTLELRKSQVKFWAAVALISYSRNHVIRILDMHVVN